MKSTKTKNAQPKTNPHKKPMEDPHERFMRKTSSASYSVPNGVQSRLAEYCGLHNKPLSEFATEALIEKLDKVGA